MYFDHAHVIFGTTFAKNPWQPGNIYVSRYTFYDAERSALKIVRGTFKSEGRKYLGRDVFYISLEGGVLYIRSEMAFLRLSARFVLVWR